MYRVIHGPRGRLHMHGPPARRSQYAILKYIASVCRECGKLLCEARLVTHSMKTLAEIADVHIFSPSARVGRRRAADPL